MAKKVIDIDGYIGGGGFSSMFVKNALKDAGKVAVEVRINSLGGELNHAIAIKDLFAAHGDVTAIYSGMSASSGTVISIGCKKISITKDSFYLIHKPMMWVDVWGSMNEDELRDLIEKLDSQKESAAAITLQMANMYAARTGQTVKAMLDLMKREVWLTADEAKEWGFVDEIIEPATITNYMEDIKLVAMIQGNGMPLPGQREAIKPPVKADESKPGIDENNIVTGLGDRIIEFFSNLLKPKDQLISDTKMEKPKFSVLSSVLQGHKPEEKEGNVTLSVEQITAIETALANAASAKQKADDDLATATTAKTTAENSLSEAVTALDALDVTIKEATDVKAKIEAVRAKLAEKPGASINGIQGDGDNEKKVIEGADEVTAYAKTLV